MRLSSGFLARTVAVAVVLLAPAPAAAAGPTLFAKSGYWQAFIDFWVSGVQKQNGIVLLAVGIGIVAIIIITRGSSQRK